MVFAARVTPRGEPPAAGVRATFPAACGPHPAGALPERCIATLRAFCFAFWTTWYPPMPVKMRLSADHVPLNATKIEVPAVRGAGSGVSARRVHGPLRNNDVSSVEGFIVLRKDTDARRILGYIAAAESHFGWHGSPPSPRKCDNPRPGPPPSAPSTRTRPHVRPRGDQRRQAPGPAGPRLRAPPPAEGPPGLPRGATLPTRAPTLDSAPRTAPPSSSATATSSGGCGPPRRRTPTRACPKHTQW
jgi:hypothetical protein